MQYLKPNVCKQLEAMGLVSESKTWWVEELKLNGNVIGENQLLSEKIIDIYGENKAIPAFTISDILLNADNARKLFGSAMGTVIYSPSLGKTFKPAESGTDSSNTVAWTFWVHHFLNLHLSGTDIEPELQKAIESKTL